VWREALAPDDAATLRQAMIATVQGGTAFRMAIPGMEVGGKTGTAETGLGPDQSHAWIIGFAGPPGEEPRVAVAVLVEARPGQGTQSGGTVAAPMAKAVLEAALQVVDADDDPDSSDDRGPSTTAPAPPQDDAPATAPATAPPVAPTTQATLPPVTTTLPPVTEATVPPSTGPPATGPPPTGP
jgi:membrane peptidoglycan carboxypeptidase